MVTIRPFYRASHGTRGRQLYFLRLALFCADEVNDFLGKNCQYIAGAIAFYMLFSMFPLVLAVISIWGFFLGADAEQAELASQLAEIIPVSSADISATMRGVASARTITGAASVFGLLWASSAAFGAIRKGINAAWGVTQTRPFIRERIIDLGMAAGAGALMLALLFVTPMATGIADLLEVVFPPVDFEFAARLITMFASPAISFITFLVLYRYMPNTDVALGDVWIGALLASLTFDGAKWGFIWYVNTFPLYNAIYGSIGAIMALLAWVYISALVLLFGALVTSRFASHAARCGGAFRALRTSAAGVARVKLRVVDAGNLSA